MIVGSLPQYRDHVPAEQIDTDSEWLQVVFGNIECVRGEIASAVLRHLTGAQYLTDMSGITTPQVKNIERFLAAFEQFFDCSKDFPVKHEIVADDLLVGGPCFAEDVDRVCFHIEEVPPFDVNHSMPGVCDLGFERAFSANLKDRHSTLFEGIVESGKQTDQKFTGCLTFNNDNGR